MASQKHFPFWTSKRMVNDEQSVLNMIPHSTTLLFEEKPNHLGWVLDYCINVVPKFLGNDRPLDIESQFRISVELDIVALIFWVGIWHHIMVRAEKIFVTECTFPQKPPSSKIILVFFFQTLNLIFQLHKSFDLEHLDFAIHSIILNRPPMKRNGFQQLLQIGGKLEIFWMRHGKPLLITSMIVIFSDLTFIGKQKTANFSKKICGF